MRHLTVAVLTPLLFATTAHAQDSTRVRRDSAAKLDTVAITATAPRTDRTDPKPLQALTLPVTVSITARKAAQTTNLVDPEDAVKYLPSVFLRKRNNGDTQAVMGTRTWGVSSSARSLIFADGVPLTALIANNNNIGGPRWGLVSPAEISRIDMMYGPFSAAYAGNSMGAVMEITTLFPDSLRGSITQTQSLQHFDLYGTSNSYSTSQTSADIGDRFGKLSVFAAGNFADSHSQPLLYVTSGTFPSGTTGGFADQNKLGATANVLGATGLLHTGMATGKIKIGYDITPKIRAAYTFGVWGNDGDAADDTYLTTNGQPTFAGQAGFASGYYHIDEVHTAHSVTLRSNLRGNWDFEVVAAHYAMNRDQQRTPVTASSTDTSFALPGRVALLDGTNWSSLDAKGTWHQGGLLATHTLTFGGHLDGYTLENPTWNTSDWRNGSLGSVFSEGDGKTRTSAVWAQDAWRITDLVKLTVGGRLEAWKGYDGFNFSGTTSIVQPEESATRFSPKAVLLWTPTEDWVVSASLAKAYRFATAAELYQLVTTGATFTSPDPDLKPDNDLSAELRVSRSYTHGFTQVALFEDDVHDAIIAQFLPLVPNSQTLYSYISNVDHVRSQGVEASFGTSDLWMKGLELNGSATYLDARTLALSGRASATAPAGSAVGKQLPNIPRWRADFLVTDHVTRRFDLSLAGRYSSLMYTTLDNADVHTNTYQGFTEWFVMDTHASLRIDRHWSATLGVDNLLDRKYFLFHPFPQRTFVASARFAF